MGNRGPCPHWQQPPPWTVEKHYLPRAPSSPDMKQARKVAWATGKAAHRQLKKEHTAQRRNTMEPLFDDKQCPSCAEEAWDREMRF